MPDIAFFISPHGYGHAARAAAVMSELYLRDATYHFAIFTKAPEWFFAETLESTSYTYHPLLTDIGVVQAGPLTENLAETHAKLKEFIPFNPHLIDNLKKELSLIGCKAVLCDISPLGLYVAESSGLPSILIENFTWDWIYEAYLPDNPEYSAPINYLSECFRKATFHIRTRPASVTQNRNDLETNPVSRQPRKPREIIRQELGIHPQDRVVLVTLGGLSETLEISIGSDTQVGIWYVIPGGSPRFEKKGRRILLPHHSRYYHPDLVKASDAVVGKAGYSTVAEAFHAGIPFAYLPRPGFRESEFLGSFIEENLGGFEIPPSDFYSGNFSKRVDELLETRVIHEPVRNGAEQIADFVSGILV